MDRAAADDVDAVGDTDLTRARFIGDAAHAMLPFLAQGAAMAIEDAAVLAHHLAGAGDIPAALAAWGAVALPLQQIARFAIERRT